MACLRPSNPASPYYEYANLSGRLDSLQHCSYKLLRLPNNLVALCIENSSIQRAAVSLSVNVGSLSDPPELQGLAHLLEHALLRGSKKYAQANEYHRYISDNMGMHNATTMASETNYAFEINNSSLQGALDRLANLLFEPLLSADDIGREINVVDSEFSGMSDNNSCRSLAVLNNTCNRMTPVNKLSTGNKVCLKKDGIFAELRKFHKSWYTPDQMTLVVVGNHKLADIIALVVASFGHIDKCSSDRPPNGFKVHPYGSLEIGKLYKYKSIGEYHRVEMVFPLKHRKIMYSKKAIFCASSLIAHEGRGSLLHWLRSKGWAGNIYGQLDDWSRDDLGVYRIILETTLLGIENLKAIVNAMFEYLYIISKDGVAKWYRGEAEIVYNALERARYTGGGAEFATYLTGVCKDIVAGCCETSSKGHHCKIGVDAFVAELNPTNYSLYVASSGNSDDGYQNMVDHYFIKYDKSELPQCLKYTSDHLDLLSKYQCKRLYMPSANPFINTGHKDYQAGVASILGCVEKSVTEPLLAHSCDRVEMWYKADKAFPPGTSVARMLLEHRGQNGCSAKESLTLMICYLYIVNVTKELQFHAKCAGMVFNIDHSSLGITVNVLGNAHMQKRLLSDLFGIIACKNQEIDICAFDQAIGEAKAMLRNFKYRDLLWQANSILKSFLESGDYCHHAKKEQQKQRHIDCMTTQDMKKMMEEFSKDICVKLLVFGNTSRSDAMETVKIVKPSKTSQPLDNTDDHNSASSAFAPLSPGIYTVRQDKSKATAKESCYVRNVICGFTSDARHCVVGRLLVKILKEPFFNQLRNVQQLGYTVGVRIASVISHRQVIQFYVQGTRDSEYLAKRVQMFIKDYLRTLKNYDEKALKHLIGSIVDAEVARQSNKAKAVSALWSQIAHGELCFLQGQPLIDCLNSITRKDLVQFWLKYICDGAASDLTCVDVHL